MQFTSLFDIPLLLNLLFLTAKALDWEICNGI